MHTAKRGPSLLPMDRLSLRHPLSFHSSSKFCLSGCEGGEDPGNVLRLASLLVLIPNVADSV